MYHNFRLEDGRCADCLVQKEAVEDGLAPKDCALASVRYLDRRLRNFELVDQDGYPGLTLKNFEGYVIEHVMCLSLKERPGVVKDLIERLLGTI